MTFASAYRALAELHDQLWRDTGLGPERTVLGGFSMGAVMSYALGLGHDRPVPGGILAFSGFIPTTEGWEPGARAAPGTAGVHLPRVPRPGDLGGVRPRRGAAADARPAWMSPTTSSRAPTTSTPATCRWRPPGWNGRSRRPARAKAHKVSGAAEDRERASMLQAGSGANGRPPARELEVIIIGAGFGGIGAAIELRRHGIRSVRILEKARRPRGHLALQQLPRDRPATSPATCTRTRSPSARTGRGCARPRTRSTPTCTTSPVTTASSP